MLADSTSYSLFCIRTAPVTGVAWTISSNSAVEMVLLKTQTRTELENDNQMCAGNTSMLYNHESSS